MAHPVPLGPHRNGGGSARDESPAPAASILRTEPKGDQAMTSFSKLTAALAIPLALTSFCLFGAGCMADAEPDDADEVSEASDGNEAVDQADHTKAPEKNQARWGEFFDDGGDFPAFGGFGTAVGLFSNCVPVSGFPFISNCGGTFPFFGGCC